MNDLDQELAGTAGTLIEWMHEQSWPLWWSSSRHENGAFYEALNFDGTPVRSAVSRVRVQARQVYSFALAIELGWGRHDIADDLQVSVDRFVTGCLRPDGLAGRLVDIFEGCLSDNTAELYDTAFALLALAQCRVVLDPGFVDPLIDRLLLGIDRHLARPGNAGYREYLPPPRVRRQNPHMHLFEALLALYAVSGRTDVAKRADRLLDFVRETFFDPKRALVAETATLDSGRCADSYEPGHSMEWVWLLGYHARLFGLALDGFALSLYRGWTEAGCREGWTPMVVAAAGLGGGDPSCRLWSQTESLKAHLCMIELGPASIAAAAKRRALDCVGALSKAWLAAPCPGGWLDHFDESGQLIAADMPGSTGYHVYLAVRELGRVTGALESRFSDNRVRPSRCPHRLRSRL